MYDVSIIMPVYNAERYLERCIESILKQVDVSIQLLLINDGSTDTSEMICRKYCKQDNRVQYYKQPNYGPAVARNKGIENSLGKYLMFVDADDYIESDGIQEMFVKAEETRADIVIAPYILEQLTGKKRTIELSFKNKIFEENDIFENIAKTYIGYSKENKNGLYSLWNKIYSRDFIINNKIVIDKKKKHGEDWLFNLDCYLCAQRITFIGTPYYHYVKYGTVDNLSTINYGYDAFLSSLISYEQVKMRFSSKGWQNFKKYDFEFQNEVYILILDIALSGEEKQRKKVEIRKILENEMLKECVTRQRGVQTKLAWIMCGTVKGKMIVMKDLVFRWGKKNMKKSRFIGR